MHQLISSTEDFKTQVAKMLGFYRFFSGIAFAQLNYCFQYTLCSFLMMLNLIHPIANLMSHWQSVKIKPQAKLKTILDFHIASFLRREVYADYGLVNGRGKCRVVLQNSL